MPVLLLLGAQTLPNTAIKAEHHDAMKSVLVKGDIVYAFAVRDPVRQERPPKAVWNEEKYTRRVAALNAIKDPDIEKMIVFSSVEDMKANLPRFPKDIVWASYNSEPGMTPAEELQNIEESVIEFAKIAHTAGLKVEWWPTNVMISQDEARYLGLAKYIDRMGLQHQRTLESEGVEAFVSLTKKRAEAIKKVNPKCSVEVQAVIGRGSTPDLIRALKAAAPYADPSVWTMQDTAAAMEILRAVRNQ